MSTPLKYLVVLILATFLCIPSNAQKNERQFKAASYDNNQLTIETSDGFMVFRPYTESSMEVEFIIHGSINAPSYAIAPNQGLVNSTFKQDENAVVFSTSKLTVEITKQPFDVSYSYNDAHLFSEEKGYFSNDSQVGFRLSLDSEEKLMGGGERVLGMDRRGQRLQLYNRASYGYETHADLMYYSMPLYISSKKYMVAFDNGASGFLDLGATENDIVQFEAVGGRMSYLIVAADEWTDLITNFTELTGRQPMVPRWALGNIASRMGYHSQAEVESVIDMYRADDFPLDAIVLDLYWFGKDVKGHMGNLEWELDSFPEPEQMLKRNREKGVKTILITEPFILKESGKYQECEDQQLLGLDSKGQPYVFDFYFGTTTLLDIFKTETKDWFWSIYKKHTLSGVDGWWGDLGEPEVHPDDLLHINGRSDEVHNLYGHEWAKTVYEGFGADFPERRPVILMRSGFIGSQRYGLVPWSGDVNRTWGGLKPQVEIALQMGMQGMAYMHSDLGGFAGSYEDAELYTRWLQYGVFQSIYRTHAQEDVPAEPIFWDEQTRDITRRFIKLRYELMPYNYTLIYENAISGVPMMRPLFYVDDTPELLDNTSSYLWGDNFLVSPVVDKGVKSHSTYLPKGQVWFNYFTGERYEGGQTIDLTVDINTIPVFVKAGSFIPTVPAFKSMDDYTSEKLTLHYYHDSSVTQSEGLMYEDDGETKEAHLKMAFEKLHFSSAFDDEVLSIKIDSDGYKYKGKPENRTVELLVHHFNSVPKYIVINGAKMKVHKTDVATYNETSGLLKVTIKNLQKTNTIEIY
ncbi:TIM-barrel domain-containing protein [Carboxylicivirga sp. N1Y90]|uniref:glycoside hydrolase family 31 protein n=1 Tax=Carboxylicivirga fragile TaxID=3417571 RepID=UPI003D357ADC|nr:DUF5110 domain-containing protein [Marinilabiliaceae bacterium N1Y90]